MSSIVVANSVETFKIKDNLALIVQQINQKEIINKPVTGKDLLFICDCSGSMYGDLSYIRKQLKNRLPVLMGDSDRISIIAFSGKNEAFILQEDVKMSNLTDYNQVHKAIDKLQPMGLTGFVEPWELADKVFSNLKSENPKVIVFLTDGQDNQWKQDEILSSVAKLKSKVSEVVFVEYGYNCNSSLLQKMAEEVSGKVIFAEDFDSYEPVFESAILNTDLASNKITVKLNNKPEFNICYSMDNDKNLTYYSTNEDNTVIIPNNVTAIYYFSNFDTLNKIEKTNPQSYTSRLPEFYSGLFALSQKMLSKEIYDYLAFLGDISLINQYMNSFGKQNLLTFNSTVHGIMKDPQKAYQEGYSPDFVFDPNVFCVIDLIDLFIEENCKLHPYHESFKYKRTTSGSIQKPIPLSEEDNKELISLQEQLKETSEIQKINEISTKLKELTDKSFMLKFEVDNKNELVGYPFIESNLVWNKDIPNLSLRIKRHGKVKLPPNSENITEVSSFDFKNYTVINNGIVYIKKLPVTVSLKAFKKLQEVKLIPASEFFDPNKIYVLDISKTPTTNNSRITDVFAEEVFNEFITQKMLEAKRKVLDYFIDKNGCDNIKIISEYENKPEFASWLKEIGITSGGFNPPRIPSKIGEQKNIDKLTLSIKGLSNFSKIEDMLDKVSNKKNLTINEKILYYFYNEFEIELNKKTNSTELKDYLLLQRNECDISQKEILRKLSQVKLSMILGKVWFKEFNSLDNSTMELTTDLIPIGEKEKLKLQVTAKLESKTIDI